MRFKLSVFIILLLLLINCSQLLAYMESHSNYSIIKETVENDDLISHFEIDTNIQLTETIEKRQSLKEGLTLDTNENKSFVELDLQENHNGRNSVNERSYSFSSDNISSVYAAYTDCAEENEEGNSEDLTEEESENNEESVSDGEEDKNEEDTGHDVTPLPENTGENPARPKTRFEFRLKYQNLANQKEGWAFTFRADKVVRLENEWALAFRFDFPLLLRDTSPTPTAQPNNQSFGTSDLVSQILFVTPRIDNFAFGFGVQNIFPVASDTPLGRGKFIIAPVFAGIYYPDAFPRGSFAGFVIRNEFSYAGNEDRPDVNQLVIQPLINVVFENKWFIGTTPDIRINWADDNSLFVPIDLTVGKIVGGNKALAVKGRVGLIKDYNFYDYEIEFTSSFFF